MKNKILFRLVSYFVTSFVIFALMIGIVFAALFSRNNIHVHKTELEKRAVNVSNTLSGMLGGSQNGEVRQGTGYGAYLRFIEDISMNEVWVVDHNMSQIPCGNSEHEDHTELQIKEIPDWSVDIVLRAIYGRKMISDSHTSFSGAPVLMTAAPIFQQDGSVMGAVLLHSHHLSGIDDATRSGVMILCFSIAAAISISALIAVILSTHFVKPLGKMKNAAMQISGGDYSVKTGVTQSDEIGELAAAMDDMVDKLEISSKENKKLDKLRRDFVAIISHELRTPVTVIRGSLEAICDGVVTDPDNVIEYHGQMLSESVYLERLVSDLLDLACLQNADFAIEFHELNLKDVLEDAVRSMRRVAESKQISIVASYDGENFITIGDYGRLRQMLIIIIDNAIKFSPERKTVRVALSESGKEIYAIICDEGCGILPDDLPNIFDRFHKQRSELNKTGTGLGLAIAKQIADRHRIFVKIASEPGNGTKITFTFRVL